jgi:hypothetical protein
VPALHLISDRTAAAMGFPAPGVGRLHQDRAGRVWRWVDDENGLGDMGGWVAPVVGIGGGIGGKIVGSLIGGAAGGPIGAGIALISSLISGIFAAHAAKVQREDQISGAWAASGPQAIQAVMDAWKSGQASSSDAIAGLQQIQQQFYQMTQPITKYKGQFGSFPDPNGPRPPNDCNWACGTSWDLNQQIKQLTQQIQAGGDKTIAGQVVGGLGSVFSQGDPMVMIGLAIIGFLLLKK